MKVSYLNDQFFSRLETLVLNLKTNLAGYFGGKAGYMKAIQELEDAIYRDEAV